MNTKELNSNSKGNFLGDLEKTLVINSLMQIPFGDRDEKWRDDFLLSIAAANLKLGNPEVTLSQDGFPYFHLQTVAAGESFQAFVIQNQLPNILEKGFGVVINAQQEQPDWVFSFGDLTNFHLTGSFYTEISNFSASTAYQAIGKDEEIMVGQPSEEIFPTYLRMHIKEFLNYEGVKNPKIMLLARNVHDENLASKDLVFNIMPTQFAAEADFQNIMNTLQWFLPKHYSFFGIDEMTVDNGFQPL